MGTTTKALQFLDHFSVERPEIGLTEFCRITGRDKATVFRHLSELEPLGFVERNPASRAYRLGPAVLRLAALREACFPVRSAVAPAVDALSRDLGELVQVSLLQGDTLASVYHADFASHGTRVNFDPGEKLPLHATASGLAVLAFGPPRLADEILANDLSRITAHTPDTADALRALIERTRDRGWSASERMFENEVVSFAVPLFGAGGEAMGAVAVPVTRATSGSIAPSPH